MKTARILTIGLAWALVVAMDFEVSAAEEGAAAVEEAIRDDGNTGLMVDNTVTFIGREFYAAFALAWLGQGGATTDKNLSVHEQPTARSGSRVWVEYNRQTLFQVFLSPTLANIEATARQAAASVAERFKIMEVERALMKNPDLAPDEF